MKKYFYLAIFLMFFSLYGFAYSSKLPIKWGRVAKSEFEIKSFRGDTSADAIILCDFGDIKITNRTFYTRHVRIKILNDRGLKYANIEIPYQSRNKHDDIITLKAQSYNLEDGRIVKYKLKRGKYSDIKIDDKWRKKVINMSDVKAGSIIEYYYTIASLDFIKLDDWYFQSEIPTLWSEVRFDAPRQFIYLVTYQKGKTLSAEEEIKFSKNLEWLYNTKRLKRRIELNEKDRVLYTSPDNNYKVWVINNMKKKIIMRNLSGIKSADGFISVKDYYPRLKFHLFESSGRLPWIYRPLIFTTLDEYETSSRWELWHSHRQTGYVHYQLDTWLEMNEKMLESKYFGMQLIKHFNYKPVFDSILPGKNSSREKMIAIYDFVNQTMRWNGQYSAKVYKGLTEPYGRKKGTSSEINMLMIYLLRRAGLEADPVLLRTSNLGMPETVYPAHNQFNHVIALVRIEGEMYLLDAIDQTKPYNMLPEKDLFTKGWIVNKHNYGWVNVKANTETGSR
ncbi:MAG: DUF3857 and transglutaminase domain-containing protein [Bacteroidales bacterium]|nr:MAG: DUF3857 and transglutaminase domain-containing protein [Bacteroidales bacterium]